MFLVINHIIVVINDSMLLQQQLPGKPSRNFKKGFIFFVCEKLVIKFSGRNKKGCRKIPRIGILFKFFHHAFIENALSFVDYFTMFKGSENYLQSINRYFHNLKLMQTIFGFETKLIDFSEQKISSKIIKNKNVCVVECQRLWEKITFSNLFACISS